MATLLNTLVRTSGGDVYDNNVAGAYSPNYTQQRKVYILQLIKRLLPYLPLWEDAQKVSVNTRTGGFGSNGVIEMRKFNALPVSTTELSEGVAPDGLNPNTATVTVQLKQYGDWIKISDVFASASIDDIFEEYKALLAENAGRKLHKVIIEALTGDSNLSSVYGGSATVAADLTAADVLTSTVIKKAVRTLRNANVPPYADGYYRAIIHPYQAYDLMNDSLWQDVAKYNGGMVGGSIDLIKGEIGKIHGVRFRESTEVLTDTAGASSAVTYHGLVYGPDAFGVFDLKNMAVKGIDVQTGKGMDINVYPINQVSLTDPMGQLGFVSWKAAFAAKLIDSNRMIRLRTGATQ